MKAKLILKFIAIITISGLFIAHYGCKEDDNEKPTASFTVDPASGPITTEFNFDASGCSDEEDPTSELKVRWDWESDGGWDEDFSSTKTISHQFTSSGAYNVKLEVKDKGGLTNSTTRSVTVNESGIITDSRDGKTYPWIIIGNQKWMTKNLDFETPLIWCADCPKYGHLYEWDVATSGSSSNTNPSGVKGLCPTGWHVPSDAEWKELEIYLGMTNAEADMPNWRGTDQGTQLRNGSTSGFNALWGGYILNTNPYGQGSEATFWTATQDSPYDGWSRRLSSNETQIFRYSSSKDECFSLRCVMD